ncbi:MAG: methyltransferase domain-containing protein [Thermodesulfovibrionia bacterium]|nr:methyltransferase domain-containing protein [Thermodesulfovibrionia bacterium]
MMFVISHIIKGVATHIPGMYKPVSKGTGGGAMLARYCYSVWLRHLVMAYKNGLSIDLHTVAELGPGDSLGIGLAALLSGADKYYAFDVVKHADNERNVKVFNELVELFNKRERIPDEVEFPMLKPLMTSYEFPHNILTAERIKASLEKKRLVAIRNAITNMGSDSGNNIQIAYYVPWYNADILKEKSVDMIFSQSALGHIDDLEHTYEALARWVKPGGYMSHVIDFSCCGFAREWNGHWAYSDLTWKLIRGGRPYLINRQPYSAHVRYLDKFGFDIVSSVKTLNNSGIGREMLASGFQNMPDEDLTTCDALIQAVRKQV